MKTSTLTWHKFDLGDKASWPEVEGNYLALNPNEFTAREYYFNGQDWWGQGYPDDLKVTRHVRLWAELPEYPTDAS